MLVKDYMTRHPIMVEASRRVIEAQRLMAESNISHLPVVGDGKRLLGLVTRERLSIRPELFDSMSVWELTDYLGRLTVGQVMLPASGLPVVGPEDTLEDAAGAIIAYQSAGLPVVEDGVVVGIITETDLLIELRNLLGAIDPGWRVVVRVPDQMGEFRKLVQVISAKNWGIMAMGCVRAPRRAGFWDIVIKVRYCGREELLAALGSIVGQEVIDIRETAAPAEG
jgi:acetoin utilization protein AcuB